MFQNKKSNRVDIQVSILTGAIVTISCSLIFLLCYYMFYNSMLKGLESRALHIHTFLENRLPMESFYRLASRDNETSTLYLNAKKQLENIKNVASVRYLYTACQTREGDFIYLIDGLPADSSDFRHVGDAIEAEIIPDMQEALSGQTVLPSQIKETSWGNIFISYFPMHENGKVIGVLGIEFDAEEQYQTLQTMRVAAPIIIVVFCILSVFIAVLLFRRISNPAYKDIAYTDMLTGLKNRNAFEIDLHNQDQRQDKSTYALLSVDLDHLKLINDTFGHTAGDEYIRKGSALLQCFIHTPDMVYRIGGDEFAVILRDKTVDELEALLQALQDCTQENDEQSLHLSAGYAIFDATLDTSLYDTLKRADAAMYLRKRMKKSNLHSSHSL